MLDLGWQSENTQETKAIRIISGYGQETQTQACEHTNSNLIT